MSKFRNWSEIEPGWHVDQSLRVAVCKEADGKWHSYATERDTVRNSPAFKTRAAAMRDAERRAKQ